MGSFCQAVNISLPRTKELAKDIVAFANTRKLAKDQLFRFGIETGIIIFEQQSVKNATLEDIDERVVRKYIEKAKLERNMDIDENEEVESILKKLDVL